MERVCEKESYSWLQLVSVQVGGAVCLPVILVGHELCRLWGFSASVGAIVFGNVFLAFLGALASEMTWKNKLTTSENAKVYFGKAGSQLVALVLAITMCGWFAIQTQVVIQDIATFVQIEPKLLLFSASLLFAVSLLFGFKGISKLADLSLPLLVGTLAVVMGWACMHSEKTLQFDISHSVQVQAISMVMALAVGVCMDMPTFFRMAKTKKDSHLASLATFLIGIPAVELCGVFLYELTGIHPLLEIFRGPQIAFWPLWITLFFLFAAWTTNICNLYSASMGVMSLFGNIKEQRAFVYTGLFAVVLAQIDLMSHLALVLDVLGIVLSSCFGVIVASFAARRPVSDIVKIVALFMAIVGGLLSMSFGLFLPTAVAVLDSTLIAAALLFLLAPIKL
jgi:cytosine permease